MWETEANIRYFAANVTFKINMVLKVFNRYCVWGIVLWIQDISTGWG